MIKPPVSDNESTRLQSLQDLNILDTPAEERFDRLTRLAKRMFDVPIALVSLVDENRQWFKSSAGLDATETARDISFCGHTILQDGILLITDATKDERFADNPLVIKDPRIRFYAGCPLRHIDGSKLGTLCIIDRKPRDFDDDDLQSLKDLAELAERELMAVQMATLDELTKISNRRGFMTLAQKALNLCYRTKMPAALVFFDLDGFKAINDQFGHAEGDRALIIFGQTMQAVFRDSDVFARLGGDEFVVLLTQAEAKTAMTTIARFRTEIEKHNAENSNAYNISFSDGVLRIEKNLQPPIEDLLNEADVLMYEKKHLKKERRKLAAGSRL